uniref:Uncharacterized protein n=1 Tax=Amphimedon queenslandica TaxID=400682 RepID=A0A1X7VK86_AMPQE
MKKAKYSLTSSSQQNPDYGINAQQLDVLKEELSRLCVEFFRREVNVDQQKATIVEEQTQLQLDDSLWFRQRQLQLTASNFEKV